MAGATALISAERGIFTEQTILVGVMGGGVRLRADTHTPYLELPVPPGHPGGQECLGRTCFASCFQNMSPVYNAKSISFSTSK